MGEQLGRQDRLFHEFCLDDRVPSDHLLRTNPPVTAGGM